jgi:Cyclin-dependent kinase regulatory subunit
MSLPAKKPRVVYSQIYRDDSGFEYCHAHLRHTNDTSRLLRRPDWERLGVEMPAGWEHYTWHERESHVLLFRRRLPVLHIPPQTCDQAIQTELTCLSEQHQDEGAPPGMTPPGHADAPTTPEIEKVLESAERGGGELEGVHTHATEENEGRPLEVEMNLEDGARGLHKRPVGGLTPTEVLRKRPAAGLTAPRRGQDLREDVVVHDQGAIDAGNAEDNKGVLVPRAAEGRRLRLRQKGPPVYVCMQANRNRAGNLKGRVQCPRCHGIVRRDVISRHWKSKTCRTVWAQSGGG